MKFYDEAKMEGTRKALEKEVLQWSGVAPKEMMGCLCYFLGKRFFAFLVTNGIVLTKLSDDDRQKLSEQIGGEVFEMGGRRVRNWIRVPLKKPEDLGQVLPFVKKSYNATIT